VKVFARAVKRAGEASIPLSVHFDLTYRCHQRCIHCYLPELWRRGEGPAPELATFQVMGILDQLAGAGSFLLAFSGGEVFLRHDLLDLLEYARRLNFSISLMTSGTCGWKRENLHSLKDLGINGLLMTLFSMDADIHDRITGVNGSWELLMRTIKTGKALGLPVVLNCIALSINCSGIGAVRRYTEGEGMPLRLELNLSRRWDGLPHPKGLALETEEQSKLLNELDGYRGDRNEEGIPAPCEADAPGCGAGKNRCYLTPCGELWPCLELPWPAGRLSDQVRLDSLWETSPALIKARMLQHGLADNGPRLCDHGCQHHEE
jgi:AdoMet-dependent heme synthase